jgi:hypothetical protein
MPTKEKEDATATEQPTAPAAPIATFIKTDDVDDERERNTTSGATSVAAVSGVTATTLSSMFASVISMASRTASEKYPLSSSLMSERRGANTLTFVGNQKKTLPRLFALETEYLPVKHK